MRPARVSNPGLLAAVLDVDAKRIAAEQAWREWRESPDGERMLKTLTAERELKAAREVRNERMGFR
jgi:hypothetical protein